MEEINELWIARENGIGGRIKLFTSKPWSADGGWYTDLSHGVLIAEELIDCEITYETSPVSVLLNLPK